MAASNSTSQGATQLVEKGQQSARIQVPPARVTPSNQPAAPSNR